MEKELNIIPPIGYEIDRQKSTFEKIVFKKIDSFPKTWKEYCRINHLKDSFSPVYGNCTVESSHTGSYDEFHTKERAEQFIALGRLLQLRDYWVGDWKPNIPNFNNSVFAVFYSDISENIEIYRTTYSNYPLTFPTTKMANEFVNCFEDLIKEAYPLV